MSFATETLILIKNIQRFFPNTLSPSSLSIQIQSIFSNLLLNFVSDSLFCVHNVIIVHTFQFFFSMFSTRRNPCVNIRINQIIIGIWRKKEHKKWFHGKVCTTPIRSESEGEQTGLTDKFEISKFSGSLQSQSNCYNSCDLRKKWVRDIHHSTEFKWNFYLSYSMKNNFTDMIVWYPIGIFVVISYA